MLSISVFVAVFGASAAAGAGNGKPQRPEDITVTAVTETSISMSWLPIKGKRTVVGYRLYLDDVWKADVPGTEYTFDGLRCGIGYRVSVVAVDASNNDLSRPMDTAVATAACVDTQPPSTPTGFSQAATTATAVVLTWHPSNDNVGVVGYGVYHEMLPVASTPEPSVTLPNLRCGTTTRFEIDAVDASGNRSPHGTAYVTTSACDDNEPPTSPTRLSVSSLTTSSLTLVWSTSTDNVRVAGYGVYVDAKFVSTTAQPETTLLDLACGRTYTVGIDAVDDAGNRSPPVAVNASTAACPPSTPKPGDTAPPSAPGGLGTSAATQTAISLYWLPSSDNVGVGGYGIYLDGSLVSTTSEQTATVSGLQCGTAYAFGVDAFDDAGNRSDPSELTASTSTCSDGQPPTAPTNLTASLRTATSITLSWSASTDNVGVAGYHLYRAGALVGETTQTTSVYSGLTCAANYTLAVEAYDAAGNRSPHATVMVATTTCPDTVPPSAPTGLAAANVTQTSLTLSWKAATDSVGVAGYGLYKNGSRLGSTSQTISTFANLSCGTSYRLGVDSFDAAGNRSAIAQIDTSTSPCPPPPVDSAVRGSGVHVHCTSSYYTDALRVATFDKLQAAGIKWVRVNIGWNSLQENSRVGWSQWYVDLVDRCIGLARARGMNVLGELLGTPSWANGGKGRYAPPDDLDDYANAAGWVADRWRGEVAAWQVWNEPNSDSFWTGTDEQYFDMIQRAYPKLKAGDPNALVVFGAPSYNDDAYIAKAYAAGVRGSFDVMATHPYQGTADLAPESGPCDSIYRFCHVPYVHDVMARYGDGNKPIWFTEFGWSEHVNTGAEPNWQRGVSAEQQADYLVRAFKHARANYPYVGVMFWYKERTSGSSSETVHQFGRGLLYMDTSPRLAWAAYRDYNQANP